MAKKAKGSLLDKSLQSHAEDETDYGPNMTDCPPGIKGGVARLSKAHVGTFSSGDNEGERFVYLGATVIKPEEHTYVPKVFEDGTRKNLKPVTVQTRGLLTSPGTFPLCEDSRGDQDENVAKAMNEIRKIGGDECTSDVSSLKDLEGMLKDLLEEKPYIGFSTKASNVGSKYPEERTWENWSGAVDYDEEEGDDDPEEEEEDEEEEGEEESEEEDLTALAALADDEEDEDAQTKLEMLADKCELDSDNYKSWADLAVAIENSAEEDEDEDEDEEGPPEKGQIYSYRPPKTKSDVTVEITQVIKTKEICNVKAVEDGKSYKGVPWSKLKVEG